MTDPTTEAAISLYAKDAGITDSEEAARIFSASDAHVRNSYRLEAIRATRWFASPVLPRPPQGLAAFVVRALEAGSPAVCCIDRECVREWAAYTEALRRVAREALDAG